MAWLIVCPHHKTGIFGLIFFFFVLFHQPTLHGVRKKTTHKIIKTVKKNFFFLKIKKYKNLLKQKYISQFNVEFNLFFQFTYAFFIASALYTSSFLPYGRFYNRLGGNKGMLVAYFYVLVYLTFSSLRKPFFLDLLTYSTLKQSKILKLN
jgi:hypothetical protein